MHLTESNSCNKTHDFQQFKNYGLKKMFLSYKQIISKIANFDKKVGYPPITSTTYHILKPQEQLQLTNKNGQYKNIKLKFYNFKIKQTKGQNC